MPRYSLQDRSNIRLVREASAELIAKVAQFPETVGDRKILRFLHGHGDDVTKAAEMFTKFLQWRIDRKVDVIRQNIVFGDFNHPSKFPHAELILKMIPQVCITTSARDKIGSPICVETYDFVPAEVLKHIPLENYIEFTIYALEYKSLIVEQLSEEADNAYLAGLTSDEEREIASDLQGTTAPWGTLVNTCVVRDLAAVGFDHIGSDGRRIINTIIGVASDNYPELLRKCYMINTPWLFQGCWFVVKGWLAANTVAKVNILGTTYMEEVNKEVSPENLPELCGGTYKDDPNELYVFDATYFLPRTNVWGINGKDSGLVAEVNPGTSTTISATTTMESEDSNGDKLPSVPTGITGTDKGDADKDDSLPPTPPS